ncbi:HesA/MoeB/ThiF family protein [Aurantibacter crassamenti]|uniref:HesA/MoeB/ThiF family protein n=1 Tax=Aurantibacter crassamenti TaxID=1837375 RepID=UPI00193A80E6|nr:HesA/MoeB/ThiF family protein [Aurantibacter crassamenti]MBM1106680.1 HesA/MoeB/ThiF family protein [Aurantibacter crassamenti]
MSAERYHRQEILKDFGPIAQQKLSDAKVLVIGAGGLGIPVLTYLNAMGVGNLGIVEHDTVSESNLHRQVIYNEADIGRQKNDAILERLKAQNSNTNLIGYNTFLFKENALKFISDYDLVVDASDNFPTRYLVNDACVILNKPFVYGALHGFEGQVSVFNHKGGPTYRCLFPNMPKADEVPNCNEHGVLGILPGIIGNLQALEAIKVLTDIGEVLSGKLLIFSALEQSYQKIKFKLVDQNTKIKTLAESYEFSCDATINSIEAVGLVPLLSDTNIELIDVRTSEEFSHKNLSLAKHIPLSELEQRHTEIDLNKPVYLVCESGVRSRKALLLLQEWYPNKTFVNVEGGMRKLNTYVNLY